MKRALWLAVLIAGLVGHQGVVTARSQDGPEEAVEMEPQWAVLDGCAETPPRIPKESGDFETFVSRQSACAEAARTVVNSGTDADRERLWSVFDDLPDDSPLKGDVTDAFLDRQVERALAALEGKPASPAGEPVRRDVEVPALLRGAPEELQQAWRLYEAITETQQKALDRPSTEVAIAFQSNEPAFHRAVAAFLRGRVSPADIVRDLGRFEWAGHCGTGSEVLYGPKAKVLVLAHLQLGQIDRALAAGAGYTGFDESAIGTDPRLLTAAGIDWERFDLGGVLSGHWELAVPLARRGSNRAARSLLVYAHILETGEVEPESGAFESLLSPLAALVEPREREERFFAIDSQEVGLRAADAEPVLAEVQQGVLDLLAKQVGPDAGLREADTASHLLVNLGRSESLPAFRAMLASPFEGVRNRGAEGLRALGETVADPLPSPPVSFRIVVDGRPVENVDVWLTLETADRGFEMKSSKSDGAGIMRVDRDSFLDPRRQVVAVRLSTSDLNATDEQWFAATVDRPPDLDAVTTVSVHTGRLTVVIPPLLWDTAQPATVVLLAVADDDGTDGESGSADTTLASGDLPVTSPHVLFPRLQHGRYKVWLRHGEDIHESPLVEVGPEPVTTTVSVDPIYSPDEEPEDRAASPTNQPL